MTSLIPNFKWAQDKNSIFMTIELLDVKEDNIKCNITRDEFSFSYQYKNHKKQKNKNYELKFNFRFGINPKTVKYHSSRHVIFKLEKENSEGWWPHIISKQDKPRLKNRVGVDWDLWRDEDESDIEDNNQYKNMPMGGREPPMGGMGGMGGMQGMQGMDDLLKRMKPNTNNKKDCSNEPCCTGIHNDDKTYENPMKDCSDEPCCTGVNMDDKTYKSSNGKKKDCSNEPCCTGVDDNKLEENVTKNENENMITVD